MLTREDHPNPDVETVDTRPFLRRTADRYSHWATAAVIVFGLPAALILLAAAPLIGFLIVAGLAFTALRYVVQRDWIALRHIVGGLVLIVAGYVAARTATHVGAPNVHGWITASRDRADVLADAGAHGHSILLSLAAFAAWVGCGLAVVGGAIVTTYVLIRPYRTRLTPRAALALCVGFGVTLGLIG